MWSDIPLEEPCHELLHCNSRYFRSLDPSCFKRRPNTFFLISISIRTLIPHGCTNNSNNSITKPPSTIRINSSIRWSPNSMPKSKLLLPRLPLLSNNTIVGSRWPGLVLRTHLRVPEVVEWPERAACLERSR